MIVDFTSKDFRFIAKEDDDPYWVVGSVVECLGDYSDWDHNMKLEDGFGEFGGMTMVSYAGYKGELPRGDSDTSGFHEFDIYYKNILIENMEMTYIELKQFIKSIDRDNQIYKILG